MTPRPPRHDGEGIDGVFAALADPTRRAVLQSLASAPATATELSEQFPISRQAVSKHLGLLDAAGLVEGTRVGRELRYSLTPEPLTGAMHWMAEVGSAWDRRLANLQKLLTR